MKKLSLIIVSLLLCIHFETACQVVFAGTFKQLGHFQMKNNMINALESLGRLRQMRAANQSELDAARNAFWKEPNNPTYLENYANCLYAKDLYFLNIELGNAVSGGYRSHVETVIGLGESFDGGIGHLCDFEYYKWAKSVISTFKSTSSNLFDVQALKNSVEKNMDGYAAYVKKRDLHEFLFKNPNSPLLRGDALQYITAAKIAVSLCEDDWETCTQSVTSELAGLSPDDINSLAASIKEKWGTSILENRQGLERVEPHYIKDMIETFINYNTKRTANYTLNEINEGVAELFNLKKNKGAIVAFTSSTCEYDYYALEQLNTLNSKFSNQGVPVVALNSYSNKGNTLEEMRRKSKGKNYSFRYFKDEYKRIAQEFGVTQTPFICVLGFTSSGEYYIQFKGPLMAEYRNQMEEIEKSVQYILSPAPSERIVDTEQLFGKGCNLE
jgi:hypothetical protein